jgi:GTP pyrophosphokinase
MLWECTQVYEGVPAEVITDDWLWETRLEGMVGYLTDDEREKLQEALHLAYTTHRDQRRKSGEPFITHPVEVTRILAEYRMDWESLAAGLLHDTVEDQPNQITFYEIEVRLPC